MCSICTSMWSQPNNSVTAPAAHYVLRLCSRQKIFLPHGLTASNKLGPPHYRGSTIAHNDASQSVGLLCKSGGLDAGTSTSRPTTLTREKTSMPPAEFETVILASERPHSQALDRATTGIKTEESSGQSMINNVISSITVILVDI